MLLVKLITGLRLSMATLMVAVLFSTELGAQEVNFFSCKGHCLAQKALKGLPPYPLDIKTKLSNPLGSDVCLKQLNGQVVKFKGVDVCQFKDQSAVDLSHLHLYSERLALPTP